MKRKFDYHLLAARDRLAVLQLVLEFDADADPRYFTVWERIAINQERGSLLDYINMLAGIMDAESVRWYLVSEKLEEKIQEVLKKAATAAAVAANRTQI